MTSLDSPTTRAPATEIAVASAAVGVTKTYGEGPTAVHALDDIHVAFARGSFTTIMGASGSGKSTLMHCLAGLDTVSRGRVLLAGQDLTGLDDRALTRIRRDQVGFVFQAFNLLPTLTARENIALPHLLRGTRPPRGLVNELASTLGIADRLDHRPSELSGGQQQRVAIARALITRPAVLFADEPTGAVDSRTGDALLAHLRRASHELGQTVVMVTHDRLAAAYADRIVELSDGRLVADTEVVR